jgi:hypothetical protein
MSQVRSVSTAIGHGLGRPGFDFRQGQDFYLLHSIQIDSGSPSLLSNVYQGLFPRGGNRSGREAHHSLPSSVAVKNGGSVPPLLHASLWCVLN